MTSTLRIAMLAVLAGSFALAGCSAADQLSRLNPFSGLTGEDPNAPPRDQRVPVLGVGESLEVSGDARVILPPAYVNDRWPQPDGFPTHSMQHTQARGSLERIWRVDIGAGSNRDRRINARPVVLDGTVYTVDGDGRVTATNADTGARQWQVRLTARDDAEGGGIALPIPFIGREGGGPDRYAFGAGIAVDGGRVYVHTGRRFLVALNASTGEEVWRETVLTPLIAAPTVADGRVYSITHENELIAFDATSGNIQWTHRAIADSARLLTAPSVAVLGDVVVAPFSSGELIALRAQNGTVLWSDSLTRAGGLTPMSSINDIAGSPVIGGTEVYALSHSGIMASFDMRTGERNWTQPASALHAPWLAGNYLFVMTSDAQLAAFERQTGNVAWITQLEAFRNERRRRDRIAWAGPVLAGNRLLVASSRGELVIINPADGSVQERRNLGDPVFIAPVIANETVYIVTDNGGLIALR
ncbi:MAG TPA: dehydrogenase [Oceanicaulis sp.]|nr:dehydrogenase [Oceanicaulis sp.]